MSATQLRGHCPDCGRQHAVVRNLMAKHGYDVKHHYFRGVCQGEHYLPIEQSRSRADVVIAAAYSSAIYQDSLAAEYRAGTKTPATAGRRYVAERRDYEDIPYDEAPAYQQVEARDLAAHQAESAARSMRSFAKHHTALVERVHGQPLEEVKRAAPPPAILAGERRVSKRGVLHCRWVRGASVRWCDEHGFLGSMSTRSWRLLPIFQPATTEEN